MVQSVATNCGRMMHLTCRNPIHMKNLEFYKLADGGSHYYFYY